MAQNSIQGLSYFKGRDSVYFSANVTAAMKTRTTYNVKVMLDVDGKVKAGNCDCPAGGGNSATCKYTTAVLLTLEHLVVKGNLAINKSSTEELQKFNRPAKLHKGSLVPFHHLQMSQKRKLNAGNNEEDGEDGESSDDSDPRPAKWRNYENYQDEFLNQIIAYSFTSGKDMHWKYTTKKSRLADSCYMIINVWIMPL